MSSDLALLVFFFKLLLATFLISLRTGNIKSNKILAFYLLVSAFDISNFIFNEFYRVHKNFDMLRANMVALEAPALFLYVKSVLQSDFRIRNIDSIHILPCVIINLVFIPRFYIATPQNKLQFYTHVNPTFEIIFTHVFLYLLMAIYLFYIFRTLKHYNTAILNNFSEQTELNKSWLTRFMQVFLFSFAIITLRNIIKFSEFQFAFTLITNFMMFITLGFISWILWQALNRPEIFKGIDSALLPKLSSIKSIPAKEAQANLDLLNKYMRESKPFLQANLNIDALASETGLTSQEISQTLNHHLGQHFYDFINGYRIEAACQKLAACEYKDKTILDILLSCGFNSKSSFNTAFKKQMKVTPSEYRKYTNKT